jgi:signal transduction histidine kinase
VLGRVFSPWRHPTTWWALTHLVTDIVVGAVTFTVVITLLALTLGLLVTFFLAIPVFWLLMVVSRGFAHLERSRLAALLGVDLPDPVPRLQSPSWWRRLLERARSRARGKEVAYLLLLLPLGALDLVLVSIAWCGSLALVALPFYVSALPGSTAKFFFFDVGSGGDAWLVAAVGLLGLVLLAPWVTVVLGRLDAVTAAWFLGPDERAAQEARVRAAERGRVAAVGSAEAERRRIERDLHDGAQQRLVSLAMELGTAREHFDDDPEAAHALVVHAHEEAKAALQELRDLVRGIHPVILEDRGLDAALSAVVARAPIPVSLEVQVEPRPSAEVESTAYFVVSEALTNVARHSGATNAAVSLVRDDGALVVEVRDNGTGGADAGDGTGLAGLGDRVASLGGSMHVDSPPGGPTILRAVLPCG